MHVWRDDRGSRVTRRLCGVLIFQCCASCRRLGTAPSGVPRRAPTQPSFSLRTSSPTAPIIITRSLASFFSARFHTSCLGLDYYWVCLQNTFWLGSLPVQQEWPMVRRTTMRLLQLSVGPAPPRQHPIALHAPCASPPPFLLS